MSLKQLKNTSCKSKSKEEIADAPLNVIIREHRIEKVDNFNYLGCHISRDQTHQKEIETRVGKVSNAFNQLRRIIWYHKCISIQAKIRIFKACALPVLVYVSELWCLATAEKQRLNTFYMKCLRAIIDVSLGDRMKNNILLQLTGQPPLENTLRRNRIRWFSHVNRMDNEQSLPMLPKKTLFAPFRDDKRPSHGVKLRWRDKMSKDLTMSDVKKLETRGSW
jgi:hypothetical protein